MEHILQLSPLQSLIILGLNIWMFVIFPVIVIRKLNHVTELLESQLYDENETQEQQEE